MTDSDDLQRAAERIVAALAKRDLRLATAESCTGGMISAYLTGVAGSSAVLDRGFVTYSNEAKIEMIGVPAALIDRCGAVSEEVARSMAEGALAASHAAIAVAVTGVAGPGGGSDAKPVGLVHFALATPERTIHAVRRFGPLGREEIRRRSVAHVFDMIEDALKL